MSAGPGSDDVRADPAAALLLRLRDLGLTIAVAESLTGGLVAAALVAVPGASLSFRGGVVSYATDLKASVLGVDTALLARSGPVDPDVARQMADGVRRLLGADVGIATTGVAGPDPQDGIPAGTVYIAVVTPEAAAVSSLALPGARADVRRETVERVLGLALGVL